MCFSPVAIFCPRPAHNQHPREPREPRENPRDPRTSQAPRAEPMQAPDTLNKDFEAVHAFLNTHATTPALLHALPSLLQCHAASMQAKIENLGKIDMHAATRLFVTSGTRMRSPAKERG